MSKKITNNKKLHRLKYWRESLGFSQDDMGALLGYSGANYCQKETGKIKVDLCEAIKIQKAFNKRRVEKGLAPLTLDEIFLEQ